ncbi:tryptophan synthase subunit alpha [Salinibacterium sp. SYSU T00001]|uniref:tryptophan synthase subunit alpha n=1 Tax=Homoserinimonas sedimenticola TaxID=2986805 RepID=UPI0022364002|nr:tryptophan synthase subunit alpha [Salinibacterium sedimenticola]MCW4386218.1 tryptophan synthase subunit alpha [Salinibacterium sedimenticola]
MSSTHPEHAHPERMPRGRTSLEVLRAEAQQEIDTVVEERLLAGEDPWVFMEELPSTDEMVVYLLRADAINADEGRSPSAVREYRVMRQIALEHPGLTRTVWRMLEADGTLKARGAA